MKDIIDKIFDQVMDEVCDDPVRRFAELVAAAERKKILQELFDCNTKAIEALRQALAQPANQSDCGHTEYKPFCQMCMATKQKPWDTSDMAHRTGGLSMDQEPVAWMYVNRDGECEQIEFGTPFDDPSVTPLYTVSSSKPWVSLTDEEVSQIYCDWLEYIKTKKDDNLRIFVLQVEAKLKEKNT